MKPTALTALVLAGGSASRLGGSKCGRRVGNRSLLQRSLDLAAATCEEVLLLPRGRRLATTAAPDTRRGELRRAAARCPEARRVADWPGVEGPLGGLGAGLQAARNDWCLLLACDMPFADLAVVRELAARAARCRADAVVLRSKGGLEPFCALYHRRLLPALRAHTARGRRSLQGFLSQVSLLEVPVASLAAGRTSDGEPLFLCNVNTPADLRRARASAAPARRTRAGLRPARGRSGGRAGARARA